jgi:hypothetical protein
MEVKGVTLVDNGAAKFPDAPIPVVPVICWS